MSDLKAEMDGNPHNADVMVIEQELRRGGQDEGVAPQSPDSLYN